MFWIIMFLVAVVVIILLLWLLQKPFYWKGKGIKYITPWPIVGNFSEVFTSGTIQLGKNLYERYPEEKLSGFHAFFSPALLVRDPDLITQLLIKSYDDFHDNALGSNQEYDQTGGNLLFLKGQQWKEVRTKVSPFFTPSKVKAMVIPAVSVAMPKAEKILDELVRTGEPCDMGFLLGQIANDVITQAVFGMESDVFQEDSRFMPLAAIFFSPKTNMMFTLKNVSKSFFKLLRLQSFDTEGAQFLKQIVRDLVDYRKKNGVKGHDFVQGIIEVMDQYGPPGGVSDGKVEYLPDGTRKPKFDFEEMFLHAFIIFLGGIESTATNMTWLFYELALNPEVQDRCREEIRSVAKSKGRPVSLEDINELPLLNGAIKESVRMYPAFPIMARLCTSQHYIEECDLTVEPGTLIMIPTQAVQRDPNIFPDPDTFNPERAEEPKAGVITTFGLGPKMCLDSAPGFYGAGAAASHPVDVKNYTAGCLTRKSFAINEIILIVSRLLQTYKFTLNPKTTSPLLASKTRPINAPATPLWLDITPATD